MGYDLSQDIEHTRFRIPVTQHEAARVVLQAVPGEYDWLDGDWRHAPTLPTLLARWRWNAVLDAAGDIVGLEFDGENLGDEATLFAALAPFVADDSWIPCDGNGCEDHWAWWFHAGRCWEVPGAVLYDLNAAAVVDITE